MRAEPLDYGEAVDRSGDRPLKRWHRVELLCSDREDDDDAGEGNRGDGGAREAAAGVRGWQGSVGEVSRMHTLEHELMLVSGVARHDERSSERPGRGTWGCARVRG